MPKRAEVDAWFDKYESPMKNVVLRVREIILNADNRIDECIKWQAPTFTFEGNLASFYPRAKKHASLMFHTGATIPGNHPRLIGTGDTARFLNVASVEEADAAKDDIGAIVRAWCEMKSKGGPAASKKTVAKKVVSAKKPAKKEVSPAPKATVNKPTARKKSL
ncbi:MAG: DUF1801 domain-containing protein [Polyangiaceae bacterium]|nr:DUF1801 domain-containing protein [Polyangiaceae bacterium]